MTSAYAVQTFVPVAEDKWVHDSARNGCTKCHESFGFFSRRHQSASGQHRRKAQHTACPAAGCRLTRLLCLPSAVCATPACPRPAAARVATCTVTRARSTGCCIATRRTRMQSSACACAVSASTNTETTRRALPSERAQAAHLTAAKQQRWARRAHHPSHTPHSPPRRAAAGRPKQPRLPLPWSALPGHSLSPPFRPPCRLRSATRSWTGRSHS